MPAMSLLSVSEIVLAEAPRAADAAWAIAT